MSQSSKSLQQAYCLTKTPYSGSVLRGELRRGMSKGLGALSPARTSLDGNEQLKEPREVVMGFDDLLENLFGRHGRKRSYGGKHGGGYGGEHHSGFGGGDPYGQGSPPVRVVVCPNCDAENPADAKFCAKCGQPLRAKATTCAKCGVEVPKGARFCPECGTAV